MSEEEKCPNCGYCDKCGRSDLKPALPLPTWQPSLSWKCMYCGQTVYSYQYHSCGGPTLTTYTIIGPSTSAANYSSSEKSQ